MAKLSDKLAKYVQLKQSIDEHQAQLSKLGEEIIKQFEDKEIKMRAVHMVENDAIVQLKSITTIQYDVEQLRDKLDADVFDEITSKHVDVESADEFIRCMKKYHIPLKVVKHFATFSRKLDRQKLSNLYDVGEVTMRDLKGCYTTKQSKSLKVKKQEKSGSN